MFFMHVHDTWYDNTVRGKVHSRVLITGGADGERSVTMRWIRVEKNRKSSVSGNPLRVPPSSARLAVMGLYFVL